MEITKAAAQPSRRAKAEWFTGTVWQDPIVEAPAPARIKAVRVTFEPGARTAWHTHPLGQTLHVVTGVGRAQVWGGPVREILPGDTVWIPPHEKHWHGASPEQRHGPHRPARAPRRRACGLDGARHGRAIRGRADGLSPHARSSRPKRKRRAGIRARTADSRVPGLRCAPPGTTCSGGLAILDSPRALGDGIGLSNNERNIHDHDHEAYRPRRRPRARGGLRGRWRLRRARPSSASAPAAPAAPTIRSAGSSRTRSRAPTARASQGLVSTAVASNGSVANVNAIQGGSSESGFTPVGRRLLGLHRHRPLRGQAEGRRPAPDRDPLSRDRAHRRPQGRQHQIGRRPQGQARLDRRAGLRHDRRFPPRARGLRHHREGHQAGIPEAGPGRRPAQGQRARRLLLRRRLSDRRDLRARDLVRHHASCRSPGRRSRSSSPSTSSSPRTPCRRASTRTSPRRRPSRSTPSGSRARSSPEDLVYKVTKALWSEETRKQLDAGHAKGKLITLKNATTGLGIPLHPGAEKFYKEAGVLK